MNFLTINTSRGPYQTISQRKNNNSSPVLTVKSTNQSTLINHINLSIDDETPSQFLDSKGGPNGYHPAGDRRYQERIRTNPQFRRALANSMCNSLVRQLSCNDSEGLLRNEYDVSNTLIKPQLKNCKPQILRLFPKTTLSTELNFNKKIESMVSSVEHDLLTSPDCLSFNLSLKSMEETKLPRLLFKPENSIKIPINIPNEDDLKALNIKLNLNIINNKKIRNKTLHKRRNSAPLNIQNKLKNMLQKVSSVEILTKTTENHKIIKINNLNLKNAHSM